MISMKKRRRLENKTDYKNRRLMLHGEKTRVVIRKTQKQLIGQVVESKEAQDSVKYTVFSNELLNYGWPKEWEGSLKSLPAAYLAGFLLGKKIGKEKKTDLIMDIGLARSIAGSRIYAFAKGIKDSGVEIACSEKMFPPKERIEGMHMKKDIKKTMDAVLDKINKGVSKK